MYHNFLIHLSVNGHADCFHVLTIVNSATGKTGVHVSLSILVSSVVMGFPSGASGKETARSAGDKRDGFDPWLGRSPGGGYDNPLQYSCLENPMDRGVHRVAQIKA